MVLSLSQSDVYSYRLWYTFAAVMIGIICHGCSTSSLESTVTSSGSVKTGSLALPVLCDLALRHPRQHINLKLLLRHLICDVQGVTLGGTGKASGDRHPKIREGVLIGAGATILGNIVVGKGAMVAAGSLVLKDVPPHRSVKWAIKTWKRK